MLQQASLQTMRNIRCSDVCILCIDAALIQETGHLSSHDLSLANLATEKEGRGLVVCVTKWDLVGLSKQSHLRQLILERLQSGLGHLKACPVVFTSATQAQNLNTLLNKSCLVYKQWCSRVPTGTLNLWLQQYTTHWPPPWRLGSQCQVKYITQVQAKPPTFVAWSNVYAHFPTHYKRQLINAIREEFGMKGVHVRLVFRTTAMPKPGVRLTKAEALKWKRLGPHQVGRRHTCTCWLCSCRMTNPSCDVIRMTQLRIVVCMFSVLGGNKTLAEIRCEEERTLAPLEGKVPARRYAQERFFTTCWPVSTTAPIVNREEPSTATATYSGLHALHTHYNAS